MRRTLKKKNLKAPLSCGEGLGVRFFAYKPHPKSTSPRLKIINLDQRSYSVRKTTPPTDVRHPSLKKGGENPNLA
jgi:hypothetical protein